MKKNNPLKSKYHKFYMTLAIETSKQSVALRRQVGAVIVLPNGLIALGFNGTASGRPNNCEWTCEDEKGYDTGKTKPEVIHAERNALDKLTREGVSPENGILFVTTAPCIECAKSLASVGITEVYYLESYKNTDGIDFLNSMNVKVQKYEYT